jgi:serine protease AprX
VGFSRRDFGILAATAVVVLSAAASASSAPPSVPAGSSKPGPARGEAVGQGHGRPPRVDDGDHNKIYDDLELKLAATAPDKQVPVIVRLTAPPTDELVEKLHGVVGKMKVERKLDIVDGVATALTKGQIKAAVRQGFVQDVSADSEVHVFNENQQATFGVLKTRNTLPALTGDGDGNASVYSPADAVVAVVDTGIDASHADLSGGKVIGFADFTVNPAVERTPYDDHGHGTHVSATIAGTGAASGGLERGVAPGAALVGAKVLDAQGSGTASGVIAGVNWVVTNKDRFGIEVMSLSLGANGCYNGTDPESQAVNAAVAAGITVVVAAGNDGEHGTCTVGTPGAAANVITVGAMGDVTNDPNSGATAGNLAWFSSRGPTLDNRIKPDIVAPGVNVTSAQANSGTGYVAESGTSMATPFVSGVAALMKIRQPSLTPLQIKSTLMTTAIDLGPPGTDIDYGAGRLNAYAALQSIGAPLPGFAPIPSDQYVTGSLAQPTAFRDFSFSAGQGELISAALQINGWSAQNGLPDFDLYVYAPNVVPNEQNFMAYSTSVIREEDVSFVAPTTGTYVLRVYDYAGAGSFFMDMQLAPLSLPISTSTPALTGAPTLGNTVSGVLNTWADTYPTPSLTGSFVRCNDAGSSCAPIAGTAGASSYRIATSSTAGAPTNLAPPTVAGPIEVGETTSLTNGTWRSTDGTLRFRVTPHTYQGYFAPEDSSASAVVQLPTTYAYQWQSCTTAVASACASISGEQESTHELTPADQGKVMSATVTATNAVGSTPMLAQFSPVILPPRASPPRPTDPPVAPPPTPRPPDPPTPAPTPPPTGRPGASPLPDLAVTATANPAAGTTLTLGQTVTYTFDVTNASSVFAVNSRFTDSLPANIVVDSADVGGVAAPCTITPTTVTCVLGAAAGGVAGFAHVQVHVVAHVSATGLTVNSANVSSVQSDANPADNATTVTHN